jgi:hypothetical protein
MRIKSAVSFRRERGFALFPFWFQKREQTTEPETGVSKMGESKFAKPRPSATWSKGAANYVV